MKLLAIDTSTDTMSIAVQHGATVLEHTGAGGAQASHSLIASIEQLMQNAGLCYAQLDAIVLGRGPGSFTGLRTACAVVQGLALGAKLRVLPLDTLQALAQEARIQAATQGLDATCVLAALDARMGEIYANCYELNSNVSSTHEGELLKRPENLMQGLAHAPSLLAGNIRPALDAFLPAQALALPYLSCLPTARALLQLAPQAIEAGAAVQAQDALPLYIRNKVALTTAEREAHNP